jgi:LacI family transcriptional regulator
LEQGSKTHLYLQIKERIIAAIVAAHYPPNSRIPPVREISKAFGVSDIPVLRAVSELAAEGVLSAQRGRGTFVLTDRIERTVSARKTSNIAMLVYDVKNLFYARLIDACERQLSERGYYLTLCNTRDSASKETEHVETLVGGRKVDGVLLCLSDAPGRSKALAFLKKRHCPFVLFPQVDTQAADGMDYVVCDDEHGAYVAVKHLIGLGHREIALLTLSPEGQPGHLVASMTKRQAGYTKAMREAGINWRPDRIIEVSGNDRQNAFEGDGFQAAQAVLARPDRPTAVFAIGDLLAAGFLRGARRMGVNVPSDVALIGHDDIGIAAQPDVQLTTVAYPFEEIGKECVEILSRRIEGWLGAPEHKMIKPILRIRATCGGANQEGD